MSAKGHGLGLSVALGAGLLGAAWLDERGSARLDEIHGVQLGMTAEQVRKHFDAAAGGSFQSVPGCSGGALEWTGDGAGDGVRQARFEFHHGMLMALRLRTSPRDESARGDALEASTGVVVAREPTAEGTVAIAVLARGCPEHDGEVQELLHGGALRR